VIALAVLFLAAAAIATAITPLARACAGRMGGIDHPAARSSHSRATPRIGGVAIAVAWGGVLVGAASVGPATSRAWLAHLPLAPMLAGAALVFIVGLLDDVKSLSPGVKILAEAIAAVIVADAGVRVDHVSIAGTTFHLGWLASSATLVWVLGVTNAFNLLDGLDGLVAGLAIIAGATCTTIVVIRGDYATAAVLLPLVGALTGFLPYNFSPATIFLGDCGSLLLGFVLAMTAITGFQKSATALAVGVPALIFALPILETVSTMMRRSIGARASGGGIGKALFGVLQPDRGHLHHRLIARGWTHRGAVLLLYAVALCLSALALMTVERL